MKIDTSKFKKVDCDDDCTTLAHPSGHQIKIAHKGLSPELREQLDSVPMNLAKGGYAKFAQKYDPNMGSKASKPSQSSNPAAGPTNLVPKPARKAYTEPDDGGTDVMVAALNREAPPFGPLAAEEKQHYPPCINPSCKSFGRPHPNCKCYGGTGGSVAEQGHFAEGGEVEKEYYCDDTRAHKKSCEYYKGGEVKGVHKPYFDKEGESVAGDKVRSMDIKKDSKKQAIDEHHKVLGEMKAMPKPKIQGLAEGDVVQPQAPQEQFNMTAPENLNQQQAPMAVNVAPSDVNPQAEGLKVEEPKYVPPSEGSEIGKEMDSAQAAANQVEPSALAPQTSAPQQKSPSQEVLDDHEATKHDLAAGYIKPEHYEDHMGKGFLGKLGTMFAMMVGGAGAALAGQPNMLMTMIDNEIKNNLNRQEKSSGLMQTGKLNEANVKGIDATTALKNYQVKLNRERLFSIDKFARYASKLPVGTPEWVKAQHTLMVMSTLADKEASSGAAQVEMAKALSDYGLGGQGNQQPTQQKGPIDYNKINQLQIKSKMKIPGAPSEQDLSNITSEANHFDQVRSLRSDFDKASDMLHNQHLAGKLSPNSRTAVLRGLEAKMAPIVGVNHAHDQVESMMPQASDWGKTYDTKKASNGQYFDVLEAGHPTLKRFGIINPPKSNEQNVAEKPATVVQNGHTYHLDPNTGKYK